MKKTMLVMTMVIAFVLSTMVSAFASTTVPGQQDRDGTVNGKYTAVYAFDDKGGTYFNLGDGREQGNADSIAELDQETLSVCDYQVVYRGDFGDDPFLDDGWIHNNITCDGYAFDGAQVYNSTYVHETDPRYSEDLEPTFGGTWGIFRDVVGGEGNLAAKAAEALIG